jgi:uncharacterized membrane protein
VTSPPRARFVRPTVLTQLAVAATLATVAFSISFLAAQYRSLPYLLPVHFGQLALGQFHLGRDDGPNGWQYKTYARVFMPVLVQMALALIFGGVGVLLLARSHRETDKQAADVIAASVAAEAVALVAFIWVAFQAYAGVALVMMWHSGRARLGGPYTIITAAGVALSVAVAVRAQKRLGRPEARAFVAEHWRFGHLYNNAADPALFVPTRTGSRWTLNFGRPVAVLLLALVLTVGIVAPTVIMGLLLR